MGVILGLCKKKPDDAEKLPIDSSVHYVNSKNIETYEQQVDSEQSSPDEKRISSGCLEVDVNHSERSSSTELHQEGYLKYRCSDEDHWLIKWCTCNGASLRYYKSDKMMSLHGVLLLHRFSIMPFYYCEEDLYGFRLYNSVSSFQFATESQDLQNQWLSSLRYYDKEASSSSDNDKSAGKYPTGEELKGQLAIDIPEIVYRSSSSLSDSELSELDDEVMDNSLHMNNYSEGKKEAKRSTALVSYTVQINQIERLLRRKEDYLEKIDSFLKGAITRHSLNDFLEEYQYILDD